MPIAREPLPPQLPLHFTTRQAIEAGVPRSTLYSATLEHPTQGVRSRRASDGVAELAAAFIPLLPASAVFSHRTAAALLSLPLPTAHPLDAVDVMTPTLNNRVRRRGVHGYRGSELRGVRLAQGFRVTAAADTFVDLGTLMPRDHLVQLGDAILARNLATLEQLVAATNAWPKRWGSRQARYALPLLAVGSASPTETIARLQIQRAGLPAPLLNFDVHDPDGQWVARVDLCWPDHRLIVEYDGKHHAREHQRRLDAQRRRQLTALGWRVVVITADDIFKREASWIGELSQLLARPAS